MYLICLKLLEWDNFLGNTSQSNNNNIFGGMPFTIFRERELTNSHRSKGYC